MDFEINGISPSAMAERFNWRMSNFFYWPLGMLLVYLSYYSDSVGVEHI